MCKDFIYKINAFRYVESRLAISIYIKRFIRNKHSKSILPCIKIFYTMINLVFHSIMLEYSYEEIPYHLALFIKHSQMENKRTNKHEITKSYTKLV
jgi:hypothetical protein